jgi:hypothetical protein
MTRGSDGGVYRGGAYSWESEPGNTPSKYARRYSGVTQRTMSQNVTFVTSNSAIESGIPVG